MSEAQSLTRAQWAALAVIVLLAICIRFYALGEVPLWLDEQCQVRTSKAGTFAEFWIAAGNDGPIGRLSYFDTWLVYLAGGATRSAFRFPAACWGVASVALTFVLGRYWFSATAGLFAAALMSVSGIHIQYSREARGYALLIVSALVLAWVFDKFARAPFENLRQPAAWAGAVLVILIAILGPQIHPVFLAPLGAVCAAELFLMWWSPDAGGVPGRVFKTITIAASLIVAIAIFSPSSSVLPVLFVDPTERPHSFFYHLSDVYKTLLGGYWGLASYAIFALAVLGTVVGIVTREFRRGTLLAIFVALAGIAPVVAGYRNGTWIVARYSLYALPFLLMLPALGFVSLLERVPGRENRNALLAMLLPLFLLGAMTMQSRSLYDLEKYKKPDPRFPDLPR